MGSVREYVEALAAVLMDRVLADSAAHARAPQRLAVRLRHARQRSTTRQQSCPAAVRAAALAHRRDSAAGGSHPRSSVEAARAAVVRAAMGLLRAELSGPFHLTLLGVGCSQFAGLGGAAAAVPASPDAPACAPSAPGPWASAAADSRVPSARTRGRDKERGATAASGEGTPRKRQRGIAAYFGGSR